MSINNEEVRRRWNPYNDPFFRGDIVFKGWPRGDYQTWFEPDIVHMQPALVKDNLFAQTADELEILQKVGRRTLACLEKLDHAAAAHFKVKPGLDDGLVLRLLNGESTEQPESYIALRYCWQSQPDGCDPTPAGQVTMPINPLLWQHFITERDTANEGIWCD